MRNFIISIYQKIIAPLQQKKKWKQFQQELIKYVNEMNTMEDPWSAELDKNLYSHQLSQILGPAKAKNYILEVGCGQGSLTQLLLPYAKKITAIEISEQALLQLKKKWPTSNSTTTQNENSDLQFLLEKKTLELIQTDIHQFFPNPEKQEKYDLIVLSFILDYLGFNKFPQKFIQLMWQFTEHLKENGKILIIHPVYKQADLHRLKAFTEIFKNFNLQIEKASTEQSSGDFPIHFILCAKYPQQKSL